MNRVSEHNMNTKEKVSPDNLTEVETSCKGRSNKCSCCGDENIDCNDWDFDEEWAKKNFNCEDCNSQWAFFYKIDHLYFYQDNHNTYKRWVAENTDQQIDEILKD